jgi:hypothetical protein
MRPTIAVYHNARNRGFERNEMNLNSYLVRDAPMGVREFEQE